MNFQNHESLQTDLFAGTHAFNQPSTLGGRAVAETYPVARVLLETDVPHLDRYFDYLIPAELDEQAQPGVRVRAKLGEQKLTGYIRTRLEHTEFMGRMKFIDDVISPVSVVTEDLFILAEKIADRYANVMSNVLRLAVPSRVVSVEKKHTQTHQHNEEKQQDDDKNNSAETNELEIIAPENQGSFAHYEGGTEFFEDLAEGAATRAVMTVLPADHEGSWEDLFARALVQVAATGKTALAVVPTNKEVDRLSKALSLYVGSEAVARLTSSDKPSERYAAYLRARSGQAPIVIGTRSAAYAPLEKLGLVLLWDDGDSNLIEQRAPYCHARDVLLLRASQQSAAALFAGFSMSSETARLVSSRWATFLSASREVIRAHTPRVVSTGEDFQLARDPLAAFARIPHEAFETARQALNRGPVLVQVSRSGYIPQLSCQRCRMAARCTQCRGPLAIHQESPAPTCDWCGRLANQWRCSECGYNRFRHAVAGAVRTAEELGRAFPNVPVISSSGEHVLSEVEDQPAIVVATPGAEPTAPSGYAATLLLDAASMLQRDSLRAPEVALRRWLNAAGLTRSFADGGKVVITAHSAPAVEALKRWDPARFALWELEERAELKLPPAVRTATLTGSETAVERFLETLQLPSDVIQRGPIEVNEFEENDDRFRALLFFSYVLGDKVTQTLRAHRAASAALKLEPVNIRCDGLDIL
ncbi:primosomal protein N' [uncultured Rothia sp.]|uniref:primosomal protein N' n=1 Tax=uncultured Rothia sp. TaxID=316088 RepID=UPI003216F1B4